jgi:GT2 family glycosyltransferase
MKTGAHDTRPRVTVVIPNYNGARFLPACLNALAEQTYRDFFVTVVDNGSTDDSVRLLAERYPHVTLIRLDRNYGFARAANEGVRRAESELVALLNNDTEVHRRWLEELVRALDARPDISFCASKMIDFYDRTIIDNAGNCYALNGRSIARGFLDRDSGQYDEMEEVFGACAGAALYRRSLFETVGHFDEEFISYKEDVDLDFRAQLKGLRCLYVPRAICYHVGGATSGKRKSDFAVQVSTRNSIVTFIKDMPRPLLLRTVPLMMFDTFFQLGYQVLKGDQAAPFIRGLVGALEKLPYALRARKRIQAGVSTDMTRLRRWLKSGTEEVVRYRARCRSGPDRA